MAAAPSALSLNRLVPSGLPFFGGKLTLSIPFEAEGNETCLRLKGRYAIAKAQLNGLEEKMALMENTLDISGQVKKGMNELTLTLYTSCRNIFGPFHDAHDPDPFGVSPDSFSRYGTWEENGVSKNYVSSYAFINVGLQSLEIS